MAGHGNFGSLDNDPPAAMRYTECRLQSISSSVLLADLEFDTVDWAPNFDGSQVPAVHHAACPLLTAAFPPCWDLHESLITWADSAHALFSSHVFSLLRLLSEGG